MRVLLLVVGRLREPYLKAAEDEYRKRLRLYCQLEVVEVKDEAALLAAVPARAHLYAFDERGAQPSSEEFAREVLDAEGQHGGGAPVVFAVGGPDGHDDAVRKKAKRLLAFGRMTINHRLVRILALEQLYRGFRILRGEPYHRD